MRRLNTSETKVDRKVSIVFITSIILLATQSAYAQTINKNIDLLMNIHYGLSITVPIVAVLIFFLLLISYMCRLIKRATFIRWAFSIIMAGAAFYISNILFYMS
ncbi:hypothetical protein MEC_01219 [Bartonella alsatica IBS 382]|uniref:Uncharacterized protein n=1 Tax=Bartonella alsatica IBS 382 TaxID=1094551 RepID=J1IU65_9HYPH|nr:hypothetical protein [Bartonella alsatica]EJF74695.1 hypothetical protein MEC_01219 [Bartonella alsatica IBS 382]